MIEEQIKLRFSKTSDVIIKVAAVVGAITALAGGYTFYLNYLWKPKVQVLEIDFSKGSAKIQLGGSPFSYGKVLQIDGETIYQLGGDWGIRFGSVLQDGITKYNRLELVRRNMVYEYLNSDK